MEYKLEVAERVNVDLLVEYKLRNIFEHAEDLSGTEIDNITEYVKRKVDEEIGMYKLIKNIVGEIIGCLLLIEYSDGMLLDEIYLNEDYRGKKIGTRIIEKIISSNMIVYLWVYKDNIKAYNLYKKLGFDVVESTKSRYFMKYSS